MSVVNHKRPLISILIPNYNYARYLPCCIDSVVRQEGDDVEIVISDNASTDESWDIICSYSDSRIKKHRHSHAIPWKDNWNSCLGNATGQYAKLLCSDDWLYPGFMVAFQGVIDQHQTEKIAAILCGYDNYDQARNQYSEPVTPSTFRIPPIFSPLGELPLTRLALHFSMPSLNVLNIEMMRACSGYGPEDAARADLILMTKTMLFSPKASVVSINEKVCCQRLHDANGRHSLVGIASHFDELRTIQLFADLASKVEDRQWIEDWEKEQSAFAVVRILKLLLSGDFGIAVRSVRQMTQLGKLRQGILSSPQFLYPLIQRRMARVWR